MPGNDNNEQFEIKGRHNKQSLSALTNIIKSTEYSVGDRVKEFQDISINYMTTLVNTGKKDLMTTLNDKDLKEMAPVVKDYRDKSYEILDMVKAPKGSYRERTINVSKAAFDLAVSGDLDILRDAGVDNDYHIYTGEFFLDTPSPRFVSKRNEKGEPTEYIIDNERYEKFMKENPFLEICEDKLNYAKNVQIPYSKAKKAGTVDEHQEREFKKATYEHLQREKEYISKINSIKYEGEVKDIYPFSTSNRIIEMNWAGNRFGKNAEDKLDRDISALEHGWSPEDLPMLDGLYQMIAGKEGLKNDKDIPKQEIDNAVGIYNNITNAYIDKKKDRKKLIESAKSLCETYKTKAEKPQNEFIELFEKGTEKEVEIVTLSADERERKDLINSLENYLNGLSVQHRGSLIKHKDSPEMEELKNKTRETIELLKSSRDKSIYESDRFVNLCFDISKLADNYAKEKRKDFEEENRRKLEDTIRKKEAKMKADALAKGEDIESKEYKYKVNEMKRSEKNKAEKQLNDWRPTTKMGKTRYEAALSMTKKIDGFARIIRSEFNNSKVISETVKEMQGEGVNIVHKQDIEYMSKRPYEAGVSQIVNYYGKEPAFVPEHCGVSNKMYTKDEFKNYLKPVKADGISNEDFALVSFAVVQDPNNIDPEAAKNMWNIKEGNYIDQIYKSKTMFTLDMAMPEPRANMARDFMSFTLVPAKEKAKEAIESYNAGDKSKLIDIMANGIKELNDECIMTDKISVSGASTNFAVGTTMMSKMIDFAKKDHELYKGVKEKLSPEVMASVEDNLRLKGFIDESIDAREKLAKSVKDKKPLSPEEKKDCINKIVREEFVSYMHNKVRKDVDNEPELMEYRANMCNLLMNAGKGVPGPSENDIHATEYKIMKKYTKPVPQINSRLRTEEGMQKLNDTVTILSAGINAGASEADILKSLKNVEKQIKEMNNQKEAGKTMDNGKVKNAENVRKQEANKKAPKKSEPKKGNPTK